MSLQLLDPSAGGVHCRPPYNAAAQDTARTGQSSRTVSEASTA
ncbi:hypothetical protein ACIQ6K_26660 [Streptomyces sp. NPDC096354]